MHSNGTYTSTTNNLINPLIHPLLVCVKISKIFQNIPFVVYYHYAQQDAFKNISNYSSHCLLPLCTTTHFAWAPNNWENIDEI